MDQDQRPGSMYTPNSAGENGQQNQQDVQPQENSSQPDATAQSAAANEEVAAIDDAVQNAPQQPAEQNFQQNPDAQQMQQPEQTPPDSSNSQEQQATQPASETQNVSLEPQPVQMMSESRSNRELPGRSMQTAENTQPSPTENEQQSDSDAPLLTWQAAEPTEASTHNVRAMLGIGLVAVAVSIVVVIFNGLNFSTVMSIIVVVLAVVAVLVSSRQHSHLESYAIYDDGVAIGNQFYDFPQIRAFSIVSFGNAASIELEPTKRFMVRRVMHLDNGTAQQAVELLGQRIPYEERTSGVVDQISSKLKL